MRNHHLPKKLFYGELEHVKRSWGDQRKRFKDTLAKSSLKKYMTDFFDFSFSQLWIKNCTINRAAKRSRDLRL